MTLFGTRRRRCTIPLAALQLVLQGLGGGAVVWAHASERTSAPVAIEAHHGPGCAVLHDALRCALCHYAGTQVAPNQATSQTPDTPLAERWLQTERSVVVTRPARLTPPPRAPPALLA